MNARHLVIGAGGARALLTGLGAVLAIRLGGLKNWSTIGGVSGGSIPALLMAAGLNPVELLDRLQKLDFSALMKSSANGHDVMERFAADESGNLPRARGWVARTLERGALHTDLLGEAVEEVVKVWPENFWTMAMTENSHVLFTQLGAIEYGFDGSITVLSEEPVPIGLAIRATCAIPGLLESVHFRGRVLFDGSLSPFGGCPVAWVRRHFLAESQTVVRCSSVGKSRTREGLLVDLGRRLLCRESKKVDVKASEGVADINIMSATPYLSTFRFKLSVEQKRAGLLAGFNAAVTELSRHMADFDGALGEISHCLDFEELLNRSGLRPAESPL